MLLVCVRHLPTEWNAKGLLQGQRDIDLIEPDAATLEQIRRNRARLDELGPFDRVYTSTLKRAKKTAVLYGYSDFISDPLANEISFGSMEGHHRDELGPQWHDDPRGLVFGESLRELEDRVKRFLATCSAFERALLFGHGSWMRALRSILQHGDSRAMNHGWIDNNEILQFEVE